MARLTSPVSPERHAAGPPLVARRESAVRLRAILFALALVPLDSLWIIQMERIRSGPFPTTISLFANAVFVLAVLVLGNQAARRIRLLRPLELTQAELL